MTIDAQIEAILFFKAEPIKTMKLAEILGVDEETARQGIILLAEKLEGRGVALLLKDDEVSLATVADDGDIIEKMVKDELHRDLGKGAIETLTIILYKGPIQKSEIDFIRGVNSNFILRNLLVRGLVEKIPHPTDQRSFLYRPTFDLLAYLGINKIEDLPEFEEFREKVEESMEQFSDKDRVIAEEVKHENFPIPSEQDQDEETAKFLGDSTEEK
ncbi:MAG: SMC-Scp complex subunit ScpB [Candidatus Parcubacteria bacterium]|nr:SMC-Scp complex subunit ScpB [Candidatus Parcubacteria bacterium]